MKYGVRWYVGDGEHGYKELEFAEFVLLPDLLDRLLSEMPEDWLFDALCDGRQEAIYWATDDFGFELYRVNDGQGQTA